ncbi:transposable element Tcb2 transposase [Trichonephila clavipes]|nr:transposable element Tcb2 transposase [Trichonephila clavipes]
MDDNAWPHQTLAVQELLESEDITRMDWPAYFPDLNPIKHLWDALGRRFAARLHHTENTQQLKQMLIDEWALLPQEMLHQLALSIRRRCEATIALACRNSGGGGRGGVAIYRPFGEFHRAKSYCHLIGAEGQRKASQVFGGKCPSGELSNNLLQRWLLRPGGLESSHSHATFLHLRVFAWAAHEFCGRGTNQRVPRLLP